MLGVILGSAFEGSSAGDLALEPETHETEFGPWTLHRVRGLAQPGVVSFRHGRPHRLLPNQIPYRAQLAALRAAGCSSLLVTSSVGLLSAELPLYEPMLVEDLLTLDNRLPDGSACSMFSEPSPGQGHLMLEEGLFSESLSEQVESLAETVGPRIAERVVFGYVGGPRGKTPAENEMWAGLGAEVNSMTLAPEVILANELEIPCAGLVVGHKRSAGRATEVEGEEAIEESLRRSRRATGRLVGAYLREATPVDFANHLYRFD